MIQAFDAALERSGADRFLTKEYVNYACYILGVLLVTHLNWSLMGTAGFLFLMWFVFNPLPSIVLGKLAFFALVFSAMLLLINRTSRADQAALVAYLFLFLTVVTAMFERKKD